jgi:glycerol-3-phosphate dehydrogenase
MIYKITTYIEVGSNPCHLGTGSWGLALAEGPKNRGLSCMLAQEKQCVVHKISTYIEVSGNRCHLGTGSWGLALAEGLGTRGSPAC